MLNSDTSVTTTHHSAGGVGGRQNSRRRFAMICSPPTPATTRSATSNRSRRGVSVRRFLRATKVSTAQLSNFGTQYNPTKALYAKTASLNWFGTTPQVVVAWPTVGVAEDTSSNNDYYYATRTWPSSRSTAA
jgi:hypothetical protein